MHACLPTRRLTSNVERVLRAQSARRRALPPTVPRWRCGALIVATLKGLLLPNGCSFFHRACCSALPSWLGQCTAALLSRCHAMPRRGASLRASTPVSSFFRKSLPFPLGMPIWRCNASVHGTASLAHTIKHIDSHPPTSHNKPIYTQLACGHVKSSTSPHVELTQSARAGVRQVNLHELAGRLEDHRARWNHAHLHLLA